MSEVRGHHCCRDLHFCNLRCPVGNGVGRITHAIFLETVIALAQQQGHPTHYPDGSIMCFSDQDCSCVQDYDSVYCISNRCECIAELGKRQATTAHPAACDHGNVCTCLDGSTGHCSHEGYCHCLVVDKLNIPSTRIDKTNHHHPAHYQIHLSLGPRLNYIREGESNDDYYVDTAIPYTDMPSTTTSSCPQRCRLLEKSRLKLPDEVLDICEKAHGYFVGIRLNQERSVA
ncbi:hypothetical protein CHS0354_012264 [Potamilus streckersoni]|uniref:Uncharacterized protein n=1 Tax=Potamilus streckersoni TaxID=2493646 RepID=A0AAE0SA91_9BIVA|nr:hypothetical protein CHS0354_012264 [Potamilus streckersoni]